MIGRSKPIPVGSETGTGMVGLLRKDLPATWATGSGGVINSYGCEFTDYSSQHDDLRLHGGDHRTHLDREPDRPAERWPEIADSPSPKTTAR
jgi:hypothetical protein